MNVMITGAGGGLGRALAGECARRGFPLFLTDLRPDGAGFARLLSEKFGVEARYLSCNLTDMQARTDFYDTLKSEQIHFWGLINVAGIDHEGPLLEKSRQQILTVLRLNVEATVDMTQEILKLRDTEQRFMLINISSLAGYSPMPFKATYAATKRFVLDFSLAIREEIRPFGTVTAVCPAGLPTTNETMRAIFAQGFWGQVTTVSTRQVARQTINRALRGKPVFIPGLINLIIHLIESLAPSILTAKFIANRWRTAQEPALEWPPLVDHEVSTQIGK